MGDHWRVSALVSQIKNPEEKLFKDLLESWKPKKYKLPKVNLEKLKMKSSCGVMSLQDIHFGKQGNETIDKDFEDTILNLIKELSCTLYRNNVFCCRR